MRFALYEGEIVDIDGCLSQLSVIKYTEEMCLKYVRGLKEIENFLRKSYGSLIYSCHTRKKRNLVIKVSFLEAPTRFELVIEVLQTFALPLGYGAISNAYLEVVRIIIKITGKKTFEKFHNLTLLTMALQIV